MRPLGYLHEEERKSETVRTDGDRREATPRNLAVQDERLRHGFRLSASPVLLLCWRLLAGGPSPPRPPRPPLIPLFLHQYRWLLGRSRASLSLAFVTDLLDFLYAQTRRLLLFSYQFTLGRTDGRTDERTRNIGYLGGFSNLEFC